MPSSVLQLVVHDLAVSPPLSGLCAGFELGKWRAAALAQELLEALPEFCLTYSECGQLNPETAVQLIRQAARRVYATDKFKNRGEFGELLLHVVLKKFVGTLPAISKIYYKDAANDTVKGFDAVHVVPNNGGLDLWLGEVKLYADIGDAISDVVKELEKHSQTDYLRAEFYAIKNKIDDASPYAEKLKALLHEHVSLDTVFQSLCVPVLLTYDGPVTTQWSNTCDEYLEALKAELFEIHARFAKKSLPKHIKIHLFLVPLSTKTELVKALDEKLKAWQHI